MDLKKRNCFREVSSQCFHFKNLPLTRFNYQYVPLGNLRTGKNSKHWLSEISTLGDKLTLSSKTWVEAGYQSIATV